MDKIKVAADERHPASALDFIHRLREVRVNEVRLAVHQGRRGNYRPGPTTAISPDPERNGSRSSLWWPKRLPPASRDGSNLPRGSGARRPLGNALAVIAVVGQHLGFERAEVDAQRCRAPSTGLRVVAAPRAHSTTGFGWLTPIMLSRVTSRARSLSREPSLPGGRIGNTR